MLRIMNCYYNIKVSKADDFNLFYFYKKMMGFLTRYFSI